MDNGKLTLDNRESTVDNGKPTLNNGKPKYCYSEMQSNIYAVVHCHGPDFRTNTAMRAVNTKCGPGQVVLDKIPRVVLDNISGDTGPSGTG